MNNDIDTLIEKHIGSSAIYRVPMRVKKKEKKINPKTNRGKNSRITRYLDTTIPPEEREVDNIPKYSDGSSKVSISDGLELKKEPQLSNKLPNVSWGWAANGSCVGFSHRAIASFRVGDKVRRDTIGNNSAKEFVIQTHKEAEEMAKKFASEVS